MLIDKYTYRSSGRKTLKDNVARQQLLPLRPTRDSDEVGSGRVNIAAMLWPKGP